MFGGSWGSTLALAYAEAYPERVSELILRGIFTLRRAELEWFYQDGCSWLFPDAFEDYVRVIPEAERGDMIAAYYRRLTASDPVTQVQAARAWSAWEGRTLSLLPDFDRVRQFSEDHYALAFARIECHYFINGGFFETDDQLIKNAARLKDIPGRDRAWPLRRGDAGQNRLRPQACLAGGRSSRGAGFRARHYRARHRA